ncbi:hypothetical protein [Arthrobacter sp. ISL-5]|uniref:hypothetical protein n=1 Tax=Arthrobacter sp. ISL-5 TaxID=2819111 RepID=UPI002035A179|nr:hypothetical protein [Arthrobacter sp. ISL-5]
MPAAVARRSGSRPIIAVAGRSLLPRERWSEMALTRVYTLAEYTDRDSSKDPDLPPRCSNGSEKTSEQASCSGSHPLQEPESPARG